MKENQKEAGKLARQHSDSRKDAGAPLRRLELFSVFEFLKLFGTLALLTLLFIGVVKWVQSTSSSAPERVPGSQQSSFETKPISGPVTDPASEPAAESLASPAAEPVKE